jgi:thiol-disulfide isomerase/thioredoxin/outer membrane lipoprotein-sorting protein
MFIVLTRPGWGQSELGSAPEALVLLERAARQYSDLKSYKITQQETYSSEHPPDSSPSKMTAVEAPGGRYRFEGDIGEGNAIQVSDGHFVWYYRPTENAYTRRPATGKKPDLPKVLSLGDIEISGAAELHDMTRFMGAFKSAKALPAEDLTLNGRPVACYVVEVTNEDRKIPLPYPFTDTIWIEKGSLKIRKIVEHYITTLNKPGSAPITYPATRISLYTEVALNEPMPDANFQFTPPATAHWVLDFSDRALPMTEAKPKGGKAPDVVFRSITGSQVRLESFRGHPVLIDLWATWCGPCVEAFPELARIYDETRSTGLVILSIDQADDPKVAQAYLEKMHYPWPNFHDQGEINKAFGSAPPPRAIVINPKGEIVFDRVSPTREELRAAIAKLGAEYARAVGNW